MGRTVSFFKLLAGLWSLWLLCACGASPTAPVSQPTAGPRQALVQPRMDQPVSPAASQLADLNKPVGQPAVFTSAEPSPVKGLSLPIRSSALPASAETPIGRSSGSGGGSASVPAPVATPTPLFYIADVQLSETGVSVMGAQAPGAIRPDYHNPEPLRLTIKGNFATETPFSEPAMRFTFEPGLLYQTFEGDLPQVRAMLNGVLLLEVVSVEAHQIEMLLPQKWLPDLYLQGLHTLLLQAGQESQLVTLKFAEPLTGASLIPVLQSAEWLPANANQPDFIHKLSTSSSHFAGIA